MTTEHLMTAIWTVIREDKLDIMWHGVGKLIDGLRRRPIYQDVADWLDAKIAADDNINKSVFIRALFAYFRDQRVVKALDDAHRANREDFHKRRQTGGAPERAAGPARRARSRR